MGKFLRENVTNLGKMSHSHFIWTSVLTPTPLLHIHSFVTVLLQLVQVLQDLEPKRNAAWTPSKVPRTCRV